MRKIVTITALLLASTSLNAQNWSVGAGSGAFAFGDFVERKVRGAATETEPSTTHTLTLSAAVRAGAAFDIERSFGDRWAVRVEAAFTRSPLSVKDDTDSGFSLKAGEIDVTTFMVPIIFRINRGGEFRVHVLGGPAYAIYRQHGRSNADDSIRVFRDSRSQWGAAAGLGVAWQWSNRFAIEGEITDIVTSSPFRRSDYPDVPGLNFPKPHNVHTKVGIRYRF